MNTTMRLSFVAVVSVIAVMACDTVPLTSPTGSTITLSIDRNVLPLNGQATVRAVVTESAGTPVHNGTMVTFQPSIGSTNPVEAPTVNGIATTTFMAGSISGTGFIHAFSGPARTGSGNASSGGVEVRIGSAAAGGMSVSASPSSVSQSGGTVTVSALVMDASNNPLPGVSVLFSTTAGSLSSSTAISDADGVARVTLTTTQTSTVTASAGAARGEVRVEASAAPNVAVAAPDTGTVGQPVTITVTFAGGSGNTSPRQIQSLRVDFGDGSSETRFNVTGSAAFTHSYGRAGGYTITATAVDVAGNTGTASDAITIGHAPQPTISAFSANPNPVPPANNGLTNITVTATPSSATVPIRSVVVRRADGTVIFSGSSGGTFAYQFPAASGSQTITATVTDANGETATSTTVVVVQ